jgi:two-component sensor histidine kinase/ligand-binding sensor domain-containing protein
VSQKFWALVGLATWATAATGAEIAPARFTRLTTDDGLSHGHVLAILQDRQGFLWFGTRLGGLNRFDGIDFKVYRHDFEDPHSLSHDFVWRLYQDRGGDLWVGTNGGGLNRYDRQSDSFVRYRHEAGNPRSLPDDNVKSIYEDRAGALWVGTDGGLGRLDRDKGTFTVYRHDPQDPQSLSDDSVRCILEDPKSGRLWLGTRRGGISILDPHTGRCTFHPYRLDDPAGLSSPSVIDMFRDQAGQLWLGSRAGLDHLETETGTFAHYRHDPRDPGSLSPGAVRAIHEDRQGRLWVATENGLDFFDRAAGRFHHYRHHPFDPESLGDDDVYALHEDDVGALWVGTANAGVARLDPEPAQFLNYRADPTDARSLSSNAVQAVHVDHAGRVWVGTTEGLDRLEGGGFVRYPHREGDARSLGGQDVRAIAEDAGGSLWVGTEGDGLSRFDGAGFVKYRHDPHDPRSLGGSDIDALHASPGGGLWVALRGVGLDYYDGRSFIHYGPDAPAPRTLPTHYVLDVLERPAGTLWLATNSSGLLRLDVATSAVQAFPLDPHHPDSESANRVHVLYGENDGALWLGSDSGLYRFDPAAATYTQHFTTRDGLPSNTVLGIVGDGHGNLWLSTPTGLSRADPPERRFRNYGRADGLPGRAFRWRSHARSADGRLYFGSSDGLTSFHPAELTENPHVPPVVFTGFDVFDRPEAVGAEGSSLSTAIHAAHEVVLGPNPSSFSVRFAALDYAAPRSNRYAYRLEGFDGRWRQTDAGRRSATYTNLDPGRYVFRVRGSNNDGVWNEAGAALTIIVTPPWWRTWWFRGAFALTTFALIAFAYRMRVRTLEERERRFRTLAESVPDLVVRYDRQPRPVYVSPAAEKYADLGVQPSAVERWRPAIQDVFAKGDERSLEFELDTPRGRRTFESRLLPERDAKGTTASVLVITRDVTGNKLLLKELHHRVKSNLEIVGSLLSLQSRHVLEKSAQVVLQDSHSRVRSMALIHEKLFEASDPARVDARPYVQALVGAVQASHGARGYLLDTAVDVDAATLDVDTAVACGLLLNELVSNALQHAFPAARPGTVDVELANEGVGRFRLRVRDDGVGFPPEVDFRRTETLGLQLVMHLVDQLDGSIELIRDGGTTFVVRFRALRPPERP